MDQGPDGRNLDEATVDLYTGFLKGLIGSVDATGPKRVDALYELSEWVKLVYLLQPGRLSSTDSVVGQQAVQELPEISNDGLKRMYVELATGDMRFVDVFDRADAAEQSVICEYSALW